MSDSPIQRWWRVGIPVTRIVRVRPAVPAEPVLVLDGNRAELEELCKAFVAAGVWQVIPADVEDTHAYRRDQLAAAFRSLLFPKPYTERPGSESAPWPLVPECHSSHVEGHECPQCAWVHEHEWVAWVDPGGPSWPPGAIPIRCAKCGGRKCDRDECPEQRHNHNHQDDGGAR